MGGMSTEQWSPISHSLVCVIRRMDHLEKKAANDRYGYGGCNINRSLLTKPDRGKSNLPHTAPICIPGTWLTRFATDYVTTAPLLQVADISVRIDPERVALAKVLAI